MSTVRPHPGDSLFSSGPQEYQLLDFGAGRKLEKFGGVILDRLSPAAHEAKRRIPNRWETADVVQANDGSISYRENSELTQEWPVAVGQLRFNVKLTPFGHVGLFPEQIGCWQWLTEQIQQFDGPTQPEALNLFAYTGGSTLAMAGAGARVVHVDASSPSVTWARRNAVSSGMEHLPIRWIVEDAAKFVAREVRRARQYDIIVMDPPSYGHGPNGKPWRIEEHLRSLLIDAMSLLRPSPLSRLLVTGHSEIFGPGEITQILSELVPNAKKLASGRLGLTDLGLRVLDAGYFVRLQNDSR